MLAFKWRKGFDLGSSRKGFATLHDELLEFLKRPVSISDDYKQPPAPPVFLPPGTPESRSVGLPGLEGGILYQLPRARPCTLSIWRGDITRWHVLGERDVIVAPANKKLSAGIGVNRAIHNAAGPHLLAACGRVANMSRLGVKCEVGEVVMTKSYQLQVRRIVHAVGPAYDDKEETPELLRSAYEKSLLIATSSGMNCIAFPAISCSSFGYPAAQGAPIALQAVAHPPDSIQQVHFVLNDVDHFTTWVHQANRMFKQASQSG